MIIEQIELTNALEFIFKSQLYKSLSGESACLQVLFFKNKKAADSLLLLFLIYKLKSSNDLSISSCWIPI